MHASLRPEDHSSFSVARDGIRRNTCRCALTGSSIATALLQSMLPTTSLFFRFPTAFCWTCMRRIEMAETHHGPRSCCSTFLSSSRMLSAVCVLEARGLTSAFVASFAWLQDSRPCRLRLSVVVHVAFLFLLFRALEPPIL